MTISTLVKKAVRIYREEGFIVCAKRTLDYVLGIYSRTVTHLCTKRHVYGSKRYLFYSIPALPLVLYTMLLLKLTSVKSCNDVNKLLNFVYRGLLTPAQIPSEISRLLNILVETRPKYILEIGTAYVGTLFLFSRVASQDATIISIDLYNPLWLSPLQKLFASQNQNIHLIRGDSHSRATLETVKSILNNNKLDFLFIDGDHSYSGVKADFEAYSPLVRKNGLIALHDIVPYPTQPEAEVHRYWNEVKQQHERTEIVADYNQKGAGIGLIKLT